MNDEHDGQSEVINSDVSGNVPCADVFEAEFSSVIIESDKNAVEELKKYTEAFDTVDEQNETIDTTGNLVFLNVAPFQYLSSKSFTK